MSNAIQVATKVNNSYNYIYKSPVIYLKNKKKEEESDDKKLILVSASLLSRMQDRVCLFRPDVEEAVLFA